MKLILKGQTKFYIYQIKSIKKIHKTQENFKWQMRKLYKFHFPFDQQWCTSSVKNLKTEILQY